MITVTEVAYLRGYEHDDHLLVDDDLAEMIGEEFEDMGEAKERAAELRGDGPARTAPIRIDAETGIGTPVYAVSRE